MCGRYVLRRVDRIATDFQVGEPDLFEEISETRQNPFTPRYNIAPSQDVAVVRINAKGDRVLGLVKWGLIPSWTQGKPKIQPINARAETVATSGMYRQAFERRRCLVPADGFYEWQKVGTRKQPMFVHKRDDGLYAFAGLWERWKPSDDAEPIDTMTIITTTPNALMQSIHDRMPVILDPQDYDRWLDRKTPGKDVADLLKPYADDDFIATPVSTKVNSPKNDTCDCIEPLVE